MLRRKKTQVCLVSSLSTLLFLEASPVPNVKNQESQGKVRWKSHPRDIRWARMGGTIRISKMSLRWRNLGCCRGRVTRLTVQVYGPGANHSGVTAVNVGVRQLGCSSCMSALPLTPTPGKPGSGTEGQRRTRRETGAREVEEVTTEESSQGQ